MLAVTLIHVVIGVGLWGVDIFLHCPATASGARQHDHVTREFADDDVKSRLDRFLVLPVDSVDEYGLVRVICIGRESQATVLHLEDVTEERDVFLVLELLGFFFRSPDDKGRHPDLESAPGKVVPDELLSLVPVYQPLVEFLVFFTSLHRCPVLPFAVGDGPIFWSFVFFLFFEPT